MNYINEVKEFHETFDHPVNNVSDNIPVEIRQLRLKLLFEELQELAEASDVMGTFNKLCNEIISNNVLNETGRSDGDDVNKVEELDALADIQYVLSGAILALGHGDNFDKAFQDVHNSNMTKLCNDIDQVNDTIDYYVNERGMDREDIIFSPNGDKFMINRKSDMKVLKNVYYQSVDLNKYC